MPALLRVLSLAALVCVSLVAAACDGKPAVRPAGPMRVVASLPPLLWIARGLAQEGSVVTSLTPPGASEHTFEPPASAVASMISADVVLLVGMGLERRAEEVLRENPRAWRRDVWFDEVVGIEASGHDHNHDHDHDHAHDHVHEGADPHLWLDPALMARFVPAVRGAIEDGMRERGVLTAEESRRLNEAQARLLAEIEAVDREHRAAIDRLGSRVLVTHHNAFPRLAERYGLEVAAVIRPIHVVEPTPGDIEQAVSAIRAKGVRAVFVEPQYSQAAARRIAELTGVKVEEVDVMGDGDWPAMMRKNLAAIVRGLGGK